MSTTGLYNGSAMEAMRHQKAHQAKGADATSQLASGRVANKASVKPSDQAISAQMESLNKVIDQAKVNAKNASAVIQVATSALSNIRNTLSTMDALAAQANSGDLDSAGRASIHDVMDKLRSGITTIATTTNWNGVNLLTGGAGTVTTVGAAAAAGTNIAGANTSIDASINANTQGYISGLVTAATATANVSGNGYDVSVTVGDQTFKSTAIEETNAGLLKLVSTSNANNIIVLDFDGAVSIADATAFQTALDTAFGLSTGGANAQFTSLATAANGGFTDVSASTTAEAGEYSVTYAADSNTLKVQNSSGESYSETLTAGGAQNVSFDNGLTVNLGAGFALNTAVTQVLVDVAQGSSVSLAFQTGAASSDTTTATFAGATTDLLGSASLKIDSISLKETSDAAAASVAIKAAMATINTMFSQLGAQQGNLESIQENLATTGENLMAAVSNYRDADIASAITEQKIAEVMSEIANIAQGKALQQSQQLLKLAQQA